MDVYVSSRSTKIIVLEALRGAAALYVFVHHSHIFKNEGFGRLFYFGQEAVIAFFLLSGFVIFFSSSQQNLSIRTYLLQRIKRIYPIFLASLAIAYASQSIIADRWLNIEPLQLIGNLSMLQDVSALKPGVWVDTYYGNSPLWSLSYEWWFYLLFIPLGLVKNELIKSNASLAALFISIVGYIGYQIYPNQLCLFAGYFYIWWSGVELSREFSLKNRLSYAAQKETLLALALMTSLWAIPVISHAIKNFDLQFGLAPALQLRHHAAALIFAVLGIFISQKQITISKAILLPFAIFAPISYAIYSIHQPILNISNYFLQDFTQWKITIVAFFITISVGWLLEIRIQKFVIRHFKSN